LQVRCPCCNIVLYGSGYERHCLLYHEALLRPSLTDYLLSPLPVLSLDEVKKTPVKTGIIRSAPQPTVARTASLSPSPGGRPAVRRAAGEEDGGSLWAGVLSQAARHFREGDAATVRQIREAKPQERWGISF
jgi:hypothetical protein